MPYLIKIDSDYYGRFDYEVYLNGKCVAGGKEIYLEDARKQAYVAAKAHSKYVPPEPVHLEYFYDPDILNCDIPGPPKSSIPGTMEKKRRWFK